MTDHISQWINPSSNYQRDELASKDYISADKLSAFSLAAGIVGMVFAPGIAHFIAVVTGWLAIQKANRVSVPLATQIKSKAGVGLVLGVFGLACVLLGLFVVFGVFGLSFGAIIMILGVGK